LLLSRACFLFNYLITKLIKSIININNTLVIWITT
jgi:hypothetical protein